MNKSWVTGERLLRWAMVAAFAHALPSLYWASGGTFGVASLGEWAPAWRAESPVFVTFALVGIFIVKAVAGVVPLLATRRLIPWPRLWRGLSWGGAVLLVIYGAANISIGGLALAGVLEGPATDAARTALLGHVFLWDALFLLWGVLLVAGLARTHRSFATGGSQPPVLALVAR